MSRAITILGSTGTIGDNTLEVMGLHPDKYSLFALTAKTNYKKLFKQCSRWLPRYAVLVDSDSAEILDKEIKSSALPVQVLSGKESLEFVASHAETDYVMAGIVGAAGLLPNLAAARAGKRVMLANKESLVMSGQLFMDAVKQNDAELLPIDSEHNAIFQCLPVSSGTKKIEDSLGVRKIILTASGGPFRLKSLDALENVTPQEACAHPNWVMGQKISVDSATMMNKGLEVIEACWLFKKKSSDIEVVVHPQSVIHSMVEYLDGSIIAQLGNPDMRTPIAYSLMWPERGVSGVKSLDLCAVQRLEFEQPDFERFPCLRLAKEAIEAGGTAPTVLNAANEIAVSAFLDLKIKFLDIPELVEYALSKHTVGVANSLDHILSADKEARDIVNQRIGSKNVS